MFDDTVIQILGSSPTNTAMKQIVGDVQEPQGQRTTYIEVEKLKFDIHKCLFIDYIEPLIDLSTFLKIEGFIYKVLKIKTYSDYMEIYLYKVRRQV
ncbi:hypothetical protein PP175_03880 [Aneurinibacillus sp. Ricciae_BoGa-3]|uniref:hypothetical protein n=1 Tax=Aneurinibacillus sp. Ricciae_BoGa-3 TaxID=3022697 RepID=UPI00234279E4|nr:hypothetical protein [Aneurinibacillus sp. Ricciae_BoGa-3]WCK55137.1 hypothetical protein PP175_03880 [Aneurinibacillus sp. Ricciae_BoGa-3]